MLRDTLILTLMLLTGTLVGCGSGNSGGGQKSLGEQQRIAMGMTNPDARASELVRLADLQFKAGDSASAKTSLAAAQGAIAEIDDEGQRAATGLTIATALARHNMQIETKDVLKLVRDSIEADENPATKASALGRMAMIYGTALENETAADVYLGEAAALIDEIPASIDRVTALLDIASAYHQIDRAEAAEAQFTTAVHAARTAETPREQADLLTAIANRMQSLEMGEAAQPIREEAHTITADITEAYSQGYALVALANSYQAAGESGKAKELLVEAEKAADQVSDSGIRGELMSKIQQAR